MDYGQYLDQLTYLLFLKMASESETQLPTNCDWQHLRAAGKGTVLETYENALTVLAASQGVLGDIYGGAVSAFHQEQSLRRMLQLLDEVNWASLDTDVQAEAFEYLLEQAAAEGKKGAGQYFTPRPLMKVIVDCVQPGALATDVVVSDPAAGTAGFLLTAAQWADENRSDSAGNFAFPELVFEGRELVARARRLALMNLRLHGVPNASIQLGDALAAPAARQANVILTNPPFGTKGGTSPERQDFWFATSNKQMNFVQHVVSTLSVGGRAAIVLPDNCFFGEGARQLWPELTRRCDVHTILRLPVGTFAPYTAGTQTNVMFFTKGSPTTATWVYDARSGVNSRDRYTPMVAEKLAEFGRCFGADPLGRSLRNEADSQDGRWVRFEIGYLREIGFRFERMQSAFVTETTEVRDPALTLAELLQELEAAVVDVQRAMKSWGNDD